MFQKTRISRRFVLRSAEFFFTLRSHHSRLLGLDDLFRGVTFSGHVLPTDLGLQTREYNIPDGVGSGGKASWLGLASTSFGRASLALQRRFPLRAVTIQARLTPAQVSERKQALPNTHHASVDKGVRQSRSNAGTTALCGSTPTRFAAQRR